MLPAAGALGSRLRPEHTRCAGGPRTSPPAALTPALAARRVPRPSPGRPQAVPASPPQAQRFAVGRGQATGGSGSLRRTAATSGQRHLSVPRPLPSAASFRAEGADSPSYQAFTRFHGNTALCSRRFPPEGWGAAHLQTPAGLNGDSCMQRARLQPAWCTER